MRRMRASGAVFMGEDGVYAAVAGLVEAVPRPPDLLRCFVDADRPGCHLLFRVGGLADHDAPVSRSRSQNCEECQPGGSVDRHVSFPFGGFGSLSVFRPASPPNIGKRRFEVTAVLGSKLTLEPLANGGCQVWIRFEKLASVTLVAVEDEPTL